MRARAILLAALVSLVLAAPPAAHASRAEWSSLAGEIAAPWPGLQERDGSFPDYTDGLIPHASTNGPGTRYGDAVMGLALLQRGLRVHDRRLVESGLEAMAFVVRYSRNHLQIKKPSVFESMAAAEGYNLARRHLAGNRTFRRIRPSWQRWLRNIRPVSTILRLPNTRRFSNHYLAEAVAVFELRRTGLRTRRRGRLLGPGFGRALAIYRRLINTGIPRVARAKDQQPFGGMPTFLISDPPDYPLAYQGLALGLYGQAVRLLGPGASAGARTALRKAVNASWLLSGPDGDIGYFGRSMEESWAQAGTALGATVAARRPGAGALERGRYRALRELVLERLRSAYGDGPRGYAFIPALRLNGRLGARALEPYAGAPSFAGLTLLQLNWMLGEMPAREARPGSVAAARHSFHATLSRARSKFTVARRGPVWFAVREGQTRQRYRGDLRYDFGLVALKHLGADGRWRDIIPLRPYTNRFGDSAGPILRRGGVRGVPWGVSMRTRRGVVTVYGGFRTSSGRWLRRGVRFRYATVGCGVRLSVGARRGDRIEWSAFVRTFHQRLRATRAEVGDAVQTLTPSPQPGAVGVERRAYYSASDPKLRRVRLRWRARRAGPLSVTVCER